MISTSTGLADNNWSSVDDWSFAVSRALRLRYEETHVQSLRCFSIPREVRVVQPTVSRVWHIGHNSSILEDSSQRNGWAVSDTAPWEDHIMQDQDDVQQMNYTLKPGRYDYDGLRCKSSGERIAKKSSCDWKKAIADCEGSPALALTRSFTSACQTACVLDLLDLLPCGEDKNFTVWSRSVSTRSKAIDNLRTACHGVMEQLVATTTVPWPRIGCVSWSET